MVESGDAPDRALTWTALLAQWTDFAQKAVALPRTGEGGRWRRAVAPIITLSAVTHALEDLDRIPDEDRPLALDRAEILCRNAARSLHEIWRGEDLPEQVRELIEDSREAFEHAANAGLEWVVAEGRLRGRDPSALVERLRRSGFAGDLFVPVTGVELVAGAPCAFARAPGGAPPDSDVCAQIASFLDPCGKVTGPRRVVTPRQVYRQVDFATGRIERDLVAPLGGDLPAGQPLLALAMVDGQAVRLPPPRRGEPIEGEIPVVELGEGESRGPDEGQ